MTVTIRSDALVGIPVAALSDLSWLLGFTEQALADNKVWQELQEVILEAIERGEVVPVVST